MNKSKKVTAVVEDPFLSSQGKSTRLNSPQNNNPFSTSNSKSNQNTTITSTIKSTTKTTPTAATSSKRHGFNGFMSRFRRTQSRDTNQNPTDVMTQQSKHIPASVFINSVIGTTSRETTFRTFAALGFDTEAFLRNIYDRISPAETALFIDALENAKDHVTQQLQNFVSVNHQSFIIASREGLTMEKYIQKLSTLTFRLQSSFSDMFTGNDMFNLYSSNVINSLDPASGTGGSSNNTRSSPKQRERERERERERTSSSSSSSSTIKPMKHWYRHKLEKISTFLKQNETSLTEFCAELRTLVYEKKFEKATLYLFAAQREGVISPFNVSSELTNTPSSRDTQHGVYLKLYDQYLQQQHHHQLLAMQQQQQQQQQQQPYRTRNIPSSSSLPLPLLDCLEWISLESDLLQYNRIPFDIPTASDVSTNASTNTNTNKIALSEFGDGIDYTSLVYQAKHIHDNADSSRSSRSSRSSISSKRRLKKRQFMQDGISTYTIGEENWEAVTDLMPHYMTGFSILDTSETSLALTAYRIYEKMCHIPLRILEGYKQLSLGYSFQDLDLHLALSLEFYSSNNSISTNTPTTGKDNVKDNKSNPSHISSTTANSVFGANTLTSQEYSEFRFLQNYIEHHRQQHYGFMSSSTSNSMNVLSQSNVYSPWTHPDVVAYQLESIRAASRGYILQVMHETALRTKDKVATNRMYTKKQDGDGDVNGKKKSGNRRRGDRGGDFNHNNHNPHNDTNLHSPGMVDGSDDRGDKGGKGSAMRNFTKIFTSKNANVNGSTTTTTGSKYQFSQNNNEVDEGRNTSTNIYTSKRSSPRNGGGGGGNNTTRINRTNRSNINRRQRSTVLPPYCGWGNIIEGYEALRRFNRNSSGRSGSSKAERFARTLAQQAIRMSSYSSAYSARRANWTRNNSFAAGQGMGQNTTNDLGNDDTSDGVTSTSNSNHNSNSTSTSSSLVDLSRTSLHDGFGVRFSFNTIRSNNSNTVTLTSSTSPNSLLASGSRSSSGSSSFTSGSSNGGTAGSSSSTTSSSSYLSSKTVSNGQYLGELDDLTILQLCRFEVRELYSHLVVQLLQLIEGSPKERHYAVRLLVLLGQSDTALRTLLSQASLKIHRATKTISFGIDHIKHLEVLTSTIVFLMSNIIIEVLILFGQGGSFNNNENTILVPTQTGNGVSLRKDMSDIGGVGGVGGVKSSRNPKTRSDRSPSSSHSNSFKFNSSYASTSTSPLSSALLRIIPTISMWLFHEITWFVTLIETHVFVPDYNASYFVRGLQTVFTAGSPIVKLGIPFDDIIVQLTLRPLIAKIMRFFKIKEQELATEVMKEEWKAITLDDASGGGSNPGSARPSSSTASSSPYTMVMSSSRLYDISRTILRDCFAIFDIPAYRNHVELQHIIIDSLTNIYRDYFSVIISHLSTATDLMYSYCPTNTPPKIALSSSQAYSMIGTLYYVLYDVCPRIKTEMIRRFGSIPVTFVYMIEDYSKRIKRTSDRFIAALAHRYVFGYIPLSMTIQSSSSGSGGSGGIGSGGYASTMSPVGPKSILEWNPMYISRYYRIEREGSNGGRNITDTRNTISLPSSLSSSSSSSSSLSPLSQHLNYVDDPEEAKISPKFLDLLDRIEREIRNIRRYGGISNMKMLVPLLFENLIHFMSNNVVWSAIYIDLPGAKQLALDLTFLFYSCASFGSFGMYGMYGAYNSGRGSLSNDGSSVGVGGGASNTSTSVPTSPPRLYKEALEPFIRKIVYTYTCTQLKIQMQQCNIILEWRNQSENDVAKCVASCKHLLENYLMYVGGGDIKSDIKAPITTKASLNDCDRKNFDSDDDEDSFDDSDDDDDDSDDDDEDDETSEDNEGVTDDDSEELEVDDIVDSVLKWVEQSKIRRTNGDTEASTTENNADKKKTKTKTTTKKPRKTKEEKQTQRLRKRQIVDKNFGILTSNTTNTNTNTHANAKIKTKTTVIYEEEEEDGSNTDNDQGNNEDEFGNHRITSVALVENVKKLETIVTQCLRENKMLIQQQDTFYDQVFQKIYAEKLPPSTIFKNLCSM